MAGNQADWIQRKIEMFQGVVRNGGEVERALLEKDEVNRATTERMARDLVVLREVMRFAGWDWIEDICHDCETGQLSIDGYARKQFLAGIHAATGLGEVAKKGLFGGSEDEKRE